MSNSNNLIFVSADPWALSPTLPNMENPMFDIINNARGTSGRPDHPRGSINIPRGENSAMRSILIKLPAQVDLIDWVEGYAKSRNVYLIVLGGKGAVSQARLGHAGSQDPPQTYTEPLALLTISGAFLFSGSAEGSHTFFSAHLGRLNGSVVSGKALRMLTTGNVELAGMFFQNPEMIAIKASYHMSASLNYNMISGRNLTRSIIIGIEAGIDIIQGVVQFACTRSLFLAVSGCGNEGLVSEVDIGSQPHSVKVSGNFQIISFSGTCDARNSASFDNIAKNFLVTVASSGGELESGVVTSMKAASHVIVVASAGNAP